MDFLAAMFLGLVLGSVLGYWSALPRVKRLEKELAKPLVMDWHLDSQKAQELSLYRLHQEQALEQSELEQRRTAQE